MNYPETDISHGNPYAQIRDQAARAAARYNLVAAGMAGYVPICEYGFQHLAAEGFYMLMWELNGSPLHGNKPGVLAPPQLRRIEELKRLCGVPVPAGRAYGG